MAKFYVSCGSHQWITSHDCAESAAMALLDEALASHVWIYDDPQLTAQQRRDHLVLETLLHLGSEIHVSERGFGHGEAGTFGTADLLEQWDRLMTSVSELLVAAGLTPRRLMPRPLSQTTRPSQPR